MVIQTPMVNSRLAEVCTSFVMNLAACRLRRPSQMITAGCVWHFQEDQNLSSTFFLGHFCGLLCFGRASYGRTSDVNRSCFSPAVNFSADTSVQKIERTERNKNTEGETCAFLERSALLSQRAKWLFTETRHSLFFGCWCTRRFKKTQKKTTPAVVERPSRSRAGNFTEVERHWGRLKKKKQGGHGYEG